MSYLLIEKTLLGEVNKEEKAIERILYYQNREEDKKNIVAFSGGKDSLVLKHLCERAAKIDKNFKYKAIYSPPSVDPPELIYYIREYHKDVYFQPYAKNKEGKEITMWSLIGNRSLPPSRMMRYCCDALKERTGDTGDTVFLGVRWSESSKRSRLHMMSFWKKKIMVRPIIDWSDEEIWEYIRKYNLPYCNLYDEGWDRLGCIGCPLNSKSQKRELELYPKYRDNYVRAFNKMLETRKRKGKETQWKNGEEVLKWWVGETVKSSAEEGQCSMFGD